MKIKDGILIVIVIAVLSSCSIVSSRGDIPENISKKYYRVFVESYELYERRVLEYKGEFLDSNDQLINFNEEGIFSDSSILEMAWEDRKRGGDRMKGGLTKEENQLKNDFIELYLIKQLDFLPQEGKKMAIKKNPKYADPIQASIKLEEKIIDTLKLDKTSVTGILLSREKVVDNNVTNKEYSRKPHQNYKPKFMNQDEWLECINSKVYTIEECIEFDQYYNQGDRRKELSEENQ